MALYGAFSKYKHFEELDEILDVGNGVLAPATRRNTALENLTGITGFDTSDMQKAKDLRSVEELTASGAVTAGVESVELNHDSVAIAATIADAKNHPGLFIVKNTSASGTAGHTLTLTAGTFNGTNDTATLNAPDEALVVYFDSAGNGTVVENVGTVALSSS